MDYEVKYKDMEKAVQDFYSVVTSLNGYAQRLNNVKHSLGWFTSLLGYRNSVGSRANAAITAANITRSAGQCLDNARIEYLLSEQTVYQLISGDRSFNIGDGVTPVAVPNVNITRPSLWKIIWDFIFPAIIRPGPGIPLPFWPFIPWWLFVYIRDYSVPSPNPGPSAVPGGEVVSPPDGSTPGGNVVQPEPQPGTGGNMKPYPGSDYSNYSVVKGFDAAYCYKQGDYPRFKHPETGRNIGCTATAEAIAASIAHGKVISPNEMGWKDYSWAQWNHSHVIPGSKPKSQAEKLQIIGEQLSAGNPVIVRANSNHSVTAIGIRDGADLSNLSPSDILIVDPDTGKVTTLDKSASGGCNMPSVSLMLPN